MAGRGNPFRNPAAESLNAAVGRGRAPGRSGARVFASGGVSGRRAITSLKRPRRAQVEDSYPGVGLPAGIPSTTSGSGVGDGFTATVHVNTLIPARPQLSSNPEQYQRGEYIFTTTNAFVHKMGCIETPKAMSIGTGPRQSNILHALSLAEANQLLTREHAEAMGIMAAALAGNDSSTMPVGYSTAQIANMARYLPGERLIAASLPTAHDPDIDNEMRMDEPIRDADGRETDQGGIVSSLFDANDTQRSNKVAAIKTMLSLVNTAPWRSLYICVISRCLRGYGFIVSNSGNAVIRGGGRANHTYGHDSSIALCPWLYAEAINVWNSTNALRNSQTLGFILGRASPGSPLQFFPAWERMPGEGLSWTQRRTFELAPLSETTPTGVATARGQVSLGGVEHGDELADKCRAKWYPVGRFYTDHMRPNDTDNITRARMAGIGYTGSVSRLVTRCGLINVLVM